MVDGIVIVVVVVVAVVGNSKYSDNYGNNNDGENDKVDDELTMLIDSFSFLILCEVKKTLFFFLSSIAFFCRISANYR